MDILAAFKELSNYCDLMTDMMTPGGNSTTLVEAWAEESEAYENGYVDPNEYGVSVVEGIYYKTKTGANGGIAYGIITK